MSAACLSHHEDAVIRDGHVGTQGSAETIMEKSWAFPTAFARGPNLFGQGPKCASTVSKSTASRRGKSEMPNVEGVTGAPPGNFNDFAPLTTSLNVGRPRGPEL